MIYLKEITEQSWLIADTDVSANVGILSHNSTNGYFIILGDQKSAFDSRDDLNAFFGCDILNTAISRSIEKDKTNFVAGFPVDLPEIYIVEDGDTELPVYKKTPKSKTTHAAGYYCIKYENGWLDSYCPKIETLQKYGYSGPFKTKLQMRSDLSRLKKQ